MIPNLIQVQRDSIENLEVAMRGIANGVVPPIRVHVAMIQAHHTNGWNTKKQKCDL